LKSGQVAAKSGGHLRIRNSPPRFAAIGIDPIGSTPEEFSVFLRKEIPRWKQIVQDADVKVEGDH
jgi:hypothetical protein